MAFCSRVRRGFGPASLIVLVGCLLAACVQRTEAPAPVVGGAAPPERGPLSVTVERGQSLSEIAHAYHVPMRAVAEANGLSPPYRIQIGRTLLIPGAGMPRAPAPPVSVAALPQAMPPAAASSAARLDGAAPAPSAEPPIQAAPLTPSPPAPIGEPAPSGARPAPAAMAAPPAPAPAGPPPHGAEPPDSGKEPTAQPRGTGAFLWPVRGHVLASYGGKSDGTHNDGINIGAPRGAPVQAADAGVVAYTGNELRGYGNLVLVKHGNGWISAYAHCDQLLVKRGDKVARGQVIARVGSTGNVSEPQLHFELRRGQHAVDPREFLAPLPTAATPREPRSG